MASGYHNAPHWLDTYANNYHQWRRMQQSGKTIYYRPQGLVERAFNADGTDFEGRADVNSTLVVEIRNPLNKQQLRRKLLIAWASLRVHHVLLFSKALSGVDFLPHSSGDDRTKRFFVVQQPKDEREILDNAKATICFLEDHYPTVDHDDFYRHLMNTARSIDPTSSLSRLFVLPLECLSNGNQILRMTLVAGHQICDGLTSYSWQSHLVDLLNIPTYILESSIGQLCLPSSLWSRLPAAQEDLYPCVPGNGARQRWYWLIARILRHKRHPPPLGFPNPLKRRQPLARPQHMPHKYSSVLDYSRTPPLNSFVANVALSHRASAVLRRLCRETRTSLGAGCFALVGLSMMDMHARLHPQEEQQQQQRPFVATFPLSPRPFLTGNPRPDSLTLFFSDGLALPWLSPDLPALSRFKVLVRRAHHQLGIYQKRKRSVEEEAALGATSARQLVPSNFLASVERADSRLPKHARRANPQGAYPASNALGGGTCGVSSIGSRNGLIRAGKYSLHLGGEGEDGFAADFRDVSANVRVRDGEFLVGSAGDDRSFYFSVSYDGNAVDEEKVRLWVDVMERLLEPDGERANL